MLTVRERKGCFDCKHSAGWVQRDPKCWHPKAQAIDPHGLSLHSPEAEEMCMQKHAFLLFKPIEDEKVAVRERPLVAEYLVTVEAPSQKTTDEEMDRVAADVDPLVKDRVDCVNDDLPPGFSARVDRLVTGMPCAACARPVLEQVEAARKAVAEATEISRKNSEDNVRLRALFEQVLNAARGAEDAGDFVLWVQERLAPGSL